MLRSFSLGSALGIPIYVHSTFLLLPMLTIWLNREGGLLSILFAEAMLLSLFGCVLLHELGHAMMGRVFGIPTRDITLYPIGGVARMESTGRRPFEEVCIALAGPAVNLVIVLLLSPFVAALALSGVSLRPTVALENGPLSLVGAYLAFLWVANSVLMVFNLLPVFPMDGGRVFRAVLAVWMGLAAATEVAAAVALVLAILLGIGGLLLGAPTLALVTVFVVVAGQMELFSVRQREAHRRVHPVESVQPMPPPPSTILPGFTGFVWDRDRQVWVRWVNGRPVEIH